MSNSNLSHIPKEEEANQLQEKEVQSETSGSTRKIKILKNIFTRSSEISKMTEEMTSIAKNISKKDEIRNKVNNYESELISAKTSVNNKENQDLPNLQKDVFNYSENQQSQKGITINSSKGSDKDAKAKPTKITFKTEYDEMQENVKCLKKLYEYQNNFYLQCQKEIEEYTSEIGGKHKTIEENNKKLEVISEELEATKSFFGQQFQDLMAELEMTERECGELRNSIQGEDQLYESLSKEAEVLQNKLKELGLEEINVKNQIHIEEEKASNSEKYLEEIKTVLGHYGRLQRDLEEDIKIIFNRKKYLNNELQELKGNIRVYCRIRPYLDSEPEEEKVSNVLKINGLSSMELIVPQNFLKSENNVKEYKFNFEHIFDHQSKQSDIFSELSQLIQSALDGYNVCIFAYGQTGSGKTYTMGGSSKDSESRGIIPRSVELIFSQIDYLKHFGWEFKIYVSVQEIYNEHARDLLTNVPDTKSEISSILVTTEKEVYPLLKRASENRAVAETMCNEHSSRSHSIFQLKLMGRNEKNNQETNGTLNLIDLAGSERLSISKAEGERLKETQAINKSLTALGDVITALANKDKHIPYRNSKLTYVLQPYLGGDSKTLMLVNLSPLNSNFHQTLCTLRFAAKVKSCEIGTAKKHIKSV